MKNRKNVIGFVIAAALVLLAGGGIFFYNQKRLHPCTGTYRAVNPPVESGEMVIETLIFNGDEVTMVSGDVSQTIEYEIRENQFTIMTDFGNFSYKIEKLEDGLVIDGICYESQG